MHQLTNPSRRKSVKILTIGNYSVLVIDIIQGLVFIPLYLNYIGERLYGLWLGTGGILAVLAFLDMGIATLTIQRVSREYRAKNYEKVSKYFSGGILINSGFMGILLAAGLVLSFILATILPEISVKENKLLTLAFQIALVGLILSLFNNTIEGTLNALQKPLLGKVFQLSGAIIGIIVVYAMLMGEKPLLAIATGTLVRAAIAFFPNIIYLSHIFIKNNIALFKYDKLILKDYLKLTPNLMISKFGTSLVSNIEPTFINIFISPEVAVYFSVTKKAGGLVKTILERIGGILYPSVAHLYSDKEKTKFNDFCIKLLHFIVPLSLLLFLVYILLNKSFVTIWVGETDYLGNIMTLLISVSLFISFFSNLLSYLLSTTGDVKFASNSVFFESTTKVILLFLMLKLLGVYGLPLALTISGLFFILIYLKRWNKHLDLNNEQIKKLVKEQGINSIVLISSALILFVLLQHLKKISLSLFIIQSIISVITLSVVLIFTNNLYLNFIKQIIIKGK